MTCVEPLADFDILELFSWIDDIKPEVVEIGRTTMSRWVLGKLKERAQRQIGSREALAQHRDIEHPGKPIYICSACDMTFNEWYEVTEHVLEKHDVFCDECQEKYIYEAVFLTPEKKERISEIHDKIKALHDELDQLLLIPIPSSRVTEK